MEVTTVVVNFSYSWFVIVRIYSFFIRRKGSLYCYTVTSPQYSTWNLPGIVLLFINNSSPVIMGSRDLGAYFCFFGESHTLWVAENYHLKERNSAPGVHSRPGWYTYMKRNFTFPGSTPRVSFYIKASKHIGKFVCVHFIKKQIH
jgi:hypothetical protein